MHDGTQGEVVSGSRTNDRPDVLVLDRSTPGTPGAPERYLMLAILRDAILQLRSHDAPDVIEAEHWIRDHETTAWPFSSICEVLGIESTSFTRSLLTWHDRPTDAAPRALGRHNRSARPRVAPLGERNRRAFGSRPSSINEAPPNDISAKRLKS